MSKILLMQDLPTHYLGSIVSAKYLKWDNSISFLLTSNMNFVNLFSTAITGIHLRQFIDTGFKIFFFFFNYQLTLRSN